MSNEEFYDKEIAPKLMQLCKQCQDHQMAFVACVEYDPDNQGIGRTEFCPPDEGGKLSAAQRITHWAARCKGNIDSLIIACIRHGQKHGHGSAYLTALGCKSEVPFNGIQMAAITITTPK